MKTDISNRHDIMCLVDNFYMKVRSDELLSPIFNEIAHVDWNEHLPKMYNFWSNILLGENVYHGFPFPPHTKLSLTKDHFLRWILLFEETIHDNFLGDRADLAKCRAVTIAEIFQMKLNIY